MVQVYRSPWVNQVSSDGVQQCLVLCKDAGCLMSSGLSGEQNRCAGAKQGQQLLLSMLKAALVSLAVLGFGWCKPPYFRVALPLQIAVCH